jgi:pilus assembly protein FimV
MNRSLKLSMLIALALGSSQVLALDMGQIQVKSALWQPLLAEIPISGATPADLKGLTVQLASNEDFARAGIVGGRTAVPLNFSVVNSGGRPVIRITSTVAVNDPYLDLLLEVNDHSGKSVREFAILLDPPNSTPGASVAAAPSAPMRSTPVRPTRTNAPASTAEASTPAPHAHHAAAEPRSDEAPAGAVKGKYGPVESGQTLSSIARSAAPGSGVSMDQMLVALKQANPDAFYRDNINALKRGVILRIPTAAEAQTLAAAAAVAEVQRQNSDWRTGRVGNATTVADTATRSPASSGASSTSTAAADRLALVSAADQQGSSGQGGRVGDKGDASSTGLRQELQRTKESLASLQQQSNDLKTRLQDLNDINSKNERLLSLKDSQIAELQNKLAAARKAAGLPPQPAPVVAAVPATAATVATKVPVAVATAATVAAPVSTASVVASAPAVASSVKAAPAVASTAAAKPRPVIVPTPAPVVEDPWYMQTWAWAAGAGAVVVLLLLALLGRRRKAAVQVEPSSASLADRFGSDSIGHDPSDIDQNELLDQLAEHPDDIGLHLELVTLYYSRRDVDHFEAAAEAMHAHITDTDQDEWQDVLHMGEDLAPGHPLFDHHVELPPHEMNEARRAFDIDHYASDDSISELEAPVPKTPSTMPPLPPTKMVSEYHFNFDGAKPEPPVSAAGKTEDEPAVPPVMPPDSHAELSRAVPAKSTPDFSFDETEALHKDNDRSVSQGLNLDDFNDDPVDTKLDLARAYVDMGDADGARAMLGEVMKEGTQIQQDVARRLLETLH